MTDSDDEKKEAGTEKKSELYFLPRDVSVTTLLGEGQEMGIEDKAVKFGDEFRRKIGIEHQAVKLGELAKIIRDKIQAAGVENWEISVEGSLEVGTGDWLPGVKTTFTATLKIMSKE
jgi:hypothetical protein